MSAAAGGSRPKLHAGYRGDRDVDGNSPIARRGEATANRSAAPVAPIVAGNRSRRMANFSHPPTSIRSAERSAAVLPATLRLGRIGAIG